MSDNKMQGIYSLAQELLALQGLCSVALVSLLVLRKLMISGW